MKILHRYKNGNYNVILYDDGTKIRIGNEEFVPEFPESIDLKITNYCSGARCSMYCHEQSSPKGEKAYISDFLNLLDRDYSGIEVAIGGGNILSHPTLIPFLNSLNHRNIVPNITVSQYNLANLDYYETFQYIRDHNLVKGIGLSLNKNSDLDISRVTLSYPHLVFHVILGVHTPLDIKKFIDDYKLDNPTFLVLGYKNWGYGIRYKTINPEGIDGIIDWWKDDIQELFPICNLSFDNLAIEQLDMKRFFTEDKWSKVYMGDDGKFTMYIDLVKMEYAKSSTSIERFKIQDGDNLTSIFKRIRE
jgi:hypothetical protein